MTTGRFGALTGFPLMTVGGICEPDGAHLMPPTVIADQTSYPRAGPACSPRHPPRRHRASILDILSGASMKTGRAPGASDGSCPNGHPQTVRSFSGCVIVAWA